MNMLKRIGLFLIVNFLVMVTVTGLLSVFKVGSGQGLASLAVFCLVWGMAGSFISLLLSRFMAKKFMRVQVIDPYKTRTDWERNLVSKVHSLSRQAGISVMPEVGVYDSPEINAFATGPTKNKSLVAVSSGLLDNFTDEELEGVLAHEVAHVANGDMVTMTLLQGVVNAFVMFLSRLIARGVTESMNRSSDSRGGGGLYFILVFVLEVVLMIFGSMVICAFSRHREYRADAGGAKLTSKATMTKSLQKLSRVVDGGFDVSGGDQVATMKINSQIRIAHLFSTHPSLSDRIKALQS
jgi:heat shock protein HtpX